MRGGQTVAQPHRQIKCLVVVHRFESSFHAHQYTITDQECLFLSDKLLAHFVQGLKQPKEERHAEQKAESIQSTGPGFTSSTNDLAPASREQPAATRPSARPTHSAHQRSRVRQGAES